MKKYFAVLLTLLLSFSCFVPIQAAANQTQMPGQAGVQFSFGIPADGSIDLFDPETMSDFLDDPSTSQGESTSSETSSQPEPDSSALPDTSTTTSETEAEVFTDDITPYAYAQNDSYVAYLYNTLLRRNNTGVTDAGVQYHAKLMSSGTSAASIAYTLAFTAGEISKYENDTARLTAMYTAFIGGTPTAEDLKPYQDEMKYGASWGYIFRSMIESDEFAEILDSFNLQLGTIPTISGYKEPDYTSLHSADYVAYLYRTLLRRDGTDTTDAGVLYHAGRMNSGTSAARIAYDLAFTAGEISKYENDTARLTAMYTAFIGGTPTAEDLKPYQDDMAHGASWGYIFRSMIESDEFAAILDSYQVKLGTIPTISGYTAPDYASANNANYIAHLYRTLLRRAGTDATDGGVQYHTSRMKSGASAAQIAYDLAFMAGEISKYENDTARLTAMYTAFIGGTPTAEDLKPYQDDMAHGASWGYIFRSMIESDEFAAILDSYQVKLGTIPTISGYTAPDYASAGNANYIAHLYRTLLRRAGTDATDAGVQYHAGRMKSGASAAQIAYDLAFMAGEISKYENDTARLTAMYTAFIGGTPTAEDLKPYQDDMKYGASWGYIFRSMIESDEFAEILDGYNLQLGTIPTISGYKEPDYTSLHSADYVAHLYRTLLRRDGTDTTDAGVLYHAGRMNSGTSAAQVAYDLAFAAGEVSKYENDTARLTAMYTAFIGGTPTAEDLMPYQEDMEYGASWGYIFRSMIESDEFAEILDSYNLKLGAIPTISGYKEPDYKIGQYAKLTRHFYIYLLRDSNAGLQDAGVLYWAGMLQSGYSVAWIAHFMSINASQASTFPDDKARLEAMFMAFWGYIPDAATLDDYLSLFDDGASWTFVFNEIITADECATFLSEEFGLTLGAMPSFSMTRPDKRYYRDVTLYLYTTLLRRDSSQVTQAELEYWANYYYKDSVAALAYSLGFNKNEVAKYESTDARIHAMYNAFQGRNANANELTAAKNALNNGASWEYIFMPLLYSSYFAGVCADMGLSVGTVRTKNYVEPGSTSVQRGLDVSNHQGDINWSQVRAAGYTFVIIRATGYYGQSYAEVDRRFYQNCRGAYAAGLKIGAYCYTYSTSTSAVNQEVDTMINAMRAMEREGIKFEYPVFWDIEDPSLSGLSTSFRTDLTLHALKRIESYGYFAGVYASKSWLENYLDTSRLSGYDVWLAQWNSTVTYKGPYTIWQYTSDGSVGGISGRVDLNYCYKNYPSILKYSGYNNLQ